MRGRDNKKVLTIGGAMYDIFINYSSMNSMALQGTQQQRSYIILEEGKKVEVESVGYHTGGGAVNTAVSFGRLGFDVSCLSKIGNDENGNFICNELEKQKINTNAIIRSAQAVTGTSFIIPSPSGNRAVLVYRGANLTLEQKEVSIPLIEQHDVVYITSLSGKASSLLPSIAQIAKMNKKLVATNPGTSQLQAGANYLKDALKNIDILILNHYEATLLMNSLMQLDDKKIQTNAQELPPLMQSAIDIRVSRFTIQEYFHEVLKRGPQIVVVTNGADGVYVTEGKNIFYHPSLKIKLVSTLGAGDAFGSTFVAYNAFGQSIENAIRAGIINSASVLQHTDTQTGLLDRMVLDTKIKALDSTLLKKFPLQTI